MTAGPRRPGPAWPTGTAGAAPRRSCYSLAKRALDIGVALVALVLLLPVLAAVAVAIRLDSRGPALFVQERVGGRRRRTGAGVVCGPEVFRMFKFRSMRADADPSLHQEHVRRYVAGEITTGGDGSAPFKLTDDDRITRVGRLIRRVSLDELPQLFNVLRGDMSLVGPRPVPVYEAVLYEADDLERFTVPSGLTGLWQVNGRCTLTFREMVDCDLQYINRRSLGLDLLILLRTIPALTKGRGAA